MGQDLRIAPALPHAETARMRFCVAIIISALATQAAHWNQFRGPEGTGHIQANLPLSWSETENVTSKTAIPGRGWSSPVLWENQIWLTTATPDGKQLTVLCLDAANGKILHQQKLFDVAEPQFAHKFNSYASPTPVVEAGRVYVSWGSPGTACIDTKTFKVLWTRRDLECDHFRGAGSSPILWNNLLINNHDGADQQYVFALDKQTGKTVWKTPRSVDFQDLDPNGKPKRDGDMRKGYSTPHIATLNGIPTLLSSGAMAHYAYNPASGRELWRVVERKQHSASTRPVFGHGLCYFPTGFGKGQLLAVVPNGKNDITETHIKWRLTRSGVPEKPSLLLISDHLYMVDDQGGLATCVDAKSGEEVWSERLGGNYSASPIVANGRIYAFSEEGKAVVYNASPKGFQKIAENKLTDGFMASPAVAGNSLILRTKTHLYRIGK